MREISPEALSEQVTHMMRTLNDPRVTTYNILDCTYR